MNISRLQYGLIIVIALVVIAFLVAQIYNRFLTTSVAGGLIDGTDGQLNSKNPTNPTNPKFAPCPNSPNCVSTMSEQGSESYIAPIVVTSVDHRESQWQTFLEKLINEMGGKLISQDGYYVHLVFKSTIMGYPDDVEIFFDNEPGIIHIRSASRVGYSDLGVNRKRVEKFRELFTKIAQPK